MARPESRLWQWWPRLFVRLDGFDPAQNSTRQSPRCKIGACYESHKRAEAPSRRGSQEVKAFERRFITIVKNWIAVDHSDRFQQSRGKERVAGNVHAIACGEQSVVHVACGAVVQG